MSEALLKIQNQSLNKLIEELKELRENYKNSLLNQGLEKAILSTQNTAEAYSGLSSTDIQAELKAYIASLNLSELLSEEQKAGLKGEKGEAGERGERGEKGEKGEPGDPATVDLSLYLLKAEAGAFASKQELLNLVKNENLQEAKSELESKIEASLAQIETLKQEQKASSAELEKLLSKDEASKLYAQKSELKDCINAFSLECLSYTQAQYDALSELEKNNNKLYFIQG